LRVEDKKSGIVTTEEEKQAYMIVRAIVVSEIPLERVVDRDTKSYFGVLVDDSNRRPICRFHFNGKNKKYLGLLDEHKTETRHQIDRLEDIYQYAEQLREAARRYR